MQFYIKPIFQTANDKEIFMSTAKLIVIDGGENVGKATQADMLLNRLMNEGFQVGKLDFPRHNQNMVGRLVEDCLSGACGEMSGLDPRVMATLYAADRYESKKQIEEWMAEGRVIIFDRYVSANMLHQGARIEDVDKRTEFFGWIEELEYGVFGMPRPQVTVYLEVPPDETLKLLEYMEDLGGVVTGPEDAAKLHQSKVTECARYLSTTQQNWNSINCLSGGELRSREDIHEDVYRAVRPFLG